MSKLPLILILAVIAAIGAVTLLVGGVNEGEPTADMQPGGNNQQTEESVVVYANSGFSPSSLIVKSGAEVVFKNESSGPVWVASDVHPTHTVYSGTSMSEHCPDTGGTVFDTCQAVQSGESWSFKFEKTGEWDYHNHLNPSRKGTILVEE